MAKPCQYLAVSLFLSTIASPEGQEESFYTPIKAGISVEGKLLEEQWARNPVECAVR